MHKDLIHFQVLFLLQHSSPILSVCPSASPYSHACIIPIDQQTNPNICFAGEGTLPPKYLRPQRFE